MDNETPALPPEWAGYVHREGLTMENLPRILTAFHIFRDMVEDGMPLPDGEGEWATEEEREEVLESVDRCFGYASRLTKLTVLAERGLDRAGYEWDPDERDAKRPAGPAGGRPRSQYSILVGQLFELANAQHRERTGGPLPEHNCQEVREGIAQRLRDLGYDEERCDPSYEGPIHETLDNYLRRRAGE